ncbi:Transcriptional regulator, GntR family [Neorhizobium galegae bv. officinalis bv. officinalis str. HAMBI 1141]|uniref:Transcriptional regulator, GntR family n=1 Tax=Neorhizobium galegae bv. officinalis bv. officinalis str. HAMBI 1141 TaxID=1028801 RepID=A0A068TDC1_NEOGA|nr:GntR family transcriptional regulator [Neorhizobium galegae]CDN56388.1 Transcriptional regulator, GntR family [Neorhizobium galegae bv. officinalis bv. officinalis str. HAMBI 1141]
MNISEKINLTDTTPEDRSPEDRSMAIRETLRNAIIDRRLAPGTKLSESEVGSLFDVSRTVARAALQMLAFEGLVKTERNRGAFVSNPSPEEARQIFASRRLIEPGIVASAVERITPEDIAEFRRQLDEEERYLNERGPAARRAEIKASGDFHLMLASVAGNVILQRFMDELVARSSLVIALYGRSGVSSCGHAEHSAVLDALEKGDGARAAKLMIHHIDHIEADLDLQLKQGLGLKDALSLA